LFNRVCQFREIRSETTEASSGTLRPSTGISTDIGCDGSPATGDDTIAGDGSDLTIPRGGPTIPRVMTASLSHLHFNLGDIAARTRLIAESRQKAGHDLF
jgi:hypothetical protein